MGLDMYLNGKRFISKYMKEGDDGIADRISELFPELKGYPTSYGQPVVREVIIEAGYWRKANAIHRWFVENVQAGEDDCKNYWVPREDLKTLKDLCQQVLDNHNLAKELLPPQEGFFFGDTNIDEYYFQCLTNTIEIIDRVLALPKEWDFEYRSSW